jgi:pyruvate dehydrogenase E2 component (dihydrolipoamide acetyltransferase)
MAAPMTAVTMPKWGIEMTEGTITGWRVREGARIERGAEILDVETEKIVNAVEAPASGVLRRVTAGEGETCAVGALIGVIADEQASDADIARFVETFAAAVVSFDSPGTGAPTLTPAVSTAAADAPSGTLRGVDQTTESGSDDARVSPIARRIALRLGVDLSRVTGTGRNGRISKEDVEAFAARTAGVQTTSPADASGTNAGASGTDVPTPAPAAASARRIRMSARRGTIARRLLESKQTIPHFRLDAEIDMGPLLQRRREHAALSADRVTLNDLLLRAVALALVRHPMVNAQLEGEEIVQFENADVALAVAAEAGLVTPIVRAANLKPVTAIAKETRDLIERARLGTLLREEISGGSFTISNLGMYGISRFDAIVNAPQVAILAVGAVSQRAVVRAGALGIAEMVTLTLSADHRVVDGAVGAAFLATLRGFLERPQALFDG